MICTRYNNWTLLLLSNQLAKERKRSSDDSRRFHNQRKHGKGKIRSHQSWPIEGDRGLASKDRYELLAKNKDESSTSPTKAATHCTSSKPFARYKMTWRLIGQPYTGSHRIMRAVRGVYKVHFLKSLSVFEVKPDVKSFCILTNKNLARVIQRDIFRMANIIYWSSKWHSMEIAATK